MKVSFKVIFVLFLTAFLAVSITVVSVVAYFCYCTVAHIIVENKSGLLIDSCEIRVSEKVFEFRNLPTGESKDFWFFAEKDDSYHLTVNFKSGIVLGANLGYVAKNMGNRDRLIIMSERIELIEEERPFFRYSIAGQREL